MDGLNSYSYVSARPVNGLDPCGLPSIENNKKCWGHYPSKEAIDSWDCTQLLLEMIAKAEVLARKVEEAQIDYKGEYPGPGWDGHRDNLECEMKKLARMVARFPLVCKCGERIPDKVLNVIEEKFPDHPFDSMDLEFQRIDHPVLCPGGRCTGEWPSDRIRQPVLEGLRQNG